MDPPRWGRRASFLSFNGGRPGRILCLLHGHHLVSFGLPLLRCLTLPARVHLLSDPLSWDLFLSNHIVSMHAIPALVAVRSHWEYPFPVLPLFLRLLLQVHLSSPCPKVHVPSHLRMVRDKARPPRSIVYVVSHSFLCTLLTSACNTDSFSIPIPPSPFTIPPRSIPLSLCPKFPYTNHTLTFSLPSYPITHSTILWKRVYRTGRFISSR